MRHSFSLFETMIHNKKFDTPKKKREIYNYIYRIFQAAYKHIHSYTWFICIYFVNKTNHWASHSISKSIRANLDQILIAQSTHYLISMLCILFYHFSSWLSLPLNLSTLVLLCLKQNNHDFNGLCAILFHIFLNILKKANLSQKLVLFLILIIWKASIARGIRIIQCFII